MLLVCALSILAFSVCSATMFGSGGEYRIEHCLTRINQPGMYYTGTPNQVNGATKCKLQIKAPLADLGILLSFVKHEPVCDQGLTIMVNETKTGQMWNVCQAGEEHVRLNSNRAIVEYPPVTNPFIVYVQFWRNKMPKFSYSMDQ